MLHTGVTSHKLGQSKKENFSCQYYLLDIPQPLGDVIKRFLLSDIIDQHNTLHKNKSPTKSPLIS